MLDELREKGITSEEVLEAMDKVPRHLFLEKAFLEIAYQNKAFPIGCEQTISHPYTVAFQTQLLEVEKGEKVLEIGTGCGYQTCVLAALGAKVFSIERQRPLFLKSQKLFKHLHVRVKSFYGDGYAGLPSFAPFDKIIVTAGAPYIPDALKEQLAIGGVMVIPVGEGSKQEMKVVVKLSENEYDITDLGTFSFVPLLEKKEWHND